VVKNSGTDPKTGKPVSVRLGNLLMAQIGLLMMKRKKFASLRRSKNIGTLL
jgi:hypothetical protein